MRFAILCVVPNWVSPPLTARALIKHGADVCIIAPPDSLAAQTRFKTADVLMPMDEIAAKLPAIVRTMAEDFGAHSILAGDNAAFTMLGQLVGRLDVLAPGSAARTLLERSMPDAETAAMVATDSRFIMAQRDGACAPPETIANPSFGEALAFAALHGFPVVVKRDGMAAGLGVRICLDADELREAMTAPEAGFVVQRFVEGMVYGVAVAGACGAKATGASFAKQVVAPYPQGPATILRHDRREDIIAHACELFERLGLNGFAGFDYIIDRTGRAHLIEINPYIVEGYVCESFGADLVAALMASARGELPAAQGAVRNEHVALFPNEWARDPASAYLQTAHHDAPWDDPALLTALIRDFPAQPRPPSVLRSRA